MQDDPMRSAFEPPTQALPPQVGHPTCVMHFRSQALCLQIFVWSLEPTEAASAVMLLLLSAYLGHVYLPLTGQS